MTEFKKSKKNPIYFLSNYAYIEDANNGKTVKWEAWSYLCDLINTFQENKEVIILKARQLGISWLVCGYALWKCLFYPNTRVLMLSMGESEAWQLISKCKFIYKRLPEFFKQGIGHDSRSVLEFPDNDSSIKALPSTEDAGSGYNSTLVIRDEIEKHPYAEANLAAIGPTVDTGGQSIDLSTVRKDRLSTHFKTRYKKARSGESNTKAVFLGWRNRPVRQEGMTLDEWFAERVVKKYPKHIIEQEYPETESEALSAVSTTAFFDTKATDLMLQDVMLPLETRHSGMIHIYKRPIPGGKYCAFLDPSGGGDPHCGVVMDWATFDVVAHTWGKCPAEQCALQFDELVREYSAFNEFEINSACGGVVGQVLTNLGTPNRRISGKDKEGRPKYGWYTAGNMSSSTRRTMMWGLEEAVRANRIRVHTLAAINELKEFYQPAGEEPCSPSGGHDDYIMALACCLQIRKERPTVEWYPPERMVGFK